MMNFKKKKESHRFFQVAAQAFAKKRIEVVFLYSKAKPDANMCFFVTMAKLMDVGYPMATANSPSRSLTHGRKKSSLGKYRVVCPHFMHSFTLICFRFHLAFFHFIHRTSIQLGPFLILGWEPKHRFEKVNPFLRQFILGRRISHSHLRSTISTEKAL